MLWRWLCFCQDVFISLAAFDSFEFDRTTETITIRAGQVWGEFAPAMRVWRSQPQPEIIIAQLLSSHPITLGIRYRFVKQEMHNIHTRVAMEMSRVHEDERDRPRSPEA